MDNTDRQGWIITKRSDGRYGVWNGHYFTIMTHAELYPETPFHETPSVKAYLATLYH